MKDWFASPYYRLLYAHRDDQEAERFVQSLLKRLELKEGTYALDAGCGEGRYARALARAGLVVDAVDEAFAHPNLPEGVRFFQADLRTWQPDRSYHLIGSFFTSFGLGMTSWDGLLRLMRRFSSWLQPTGWLVVDYLNIYQRNPIAYEERQVGEIVFRIQRWQDAFSLYKRITVEDPAAGKHVFEEQVFKLTQGDLTGLAQRAGLTVVEFWGDYEAGPFDIEKSPRLILLAQKPVS
ncbi:MAG: hypothetical protein KatS3mg026_0769 [Bacteroidia bacterium]|nr:MAG: hypothetical protein KatS3mg026_0769 [Bacteroidia bacterium]